MIRLKVRDLQLTERKWPLLVRANYKTDLLHISTHNGLWKDPSESRYARDRSFIVTQCNRPFECAVYFVIGVCKLTDYQLCSTCGTPEDFEAALKAHKVAFAAQRLEQKRKEAERQDERQHDAEARAHLASKIAALLGAALSFKAWAEHGKVFVKYNGILYRLPVMEEKINGS